MLVVSQGHSISRLLWWEGFVLWHKPPRKSPNREEPPRLAGRATASGHTSPVGGHAGEGVLYSTVRLRQSIGYLRAAITRDGSLRPHAPSEIACRLRRPENSARQGTLFWSLTPGSSPEIGRQSDSHTHSPWEPPEAKTSSRRYRLHKTARQPFRRCTSPAAREAFASTHAGRRQHHLDAAYENATALQHRRRSRGTAPTWATLPCYSVVAARTDGHEARRACSSRISLTPPTMRGTGHHTGGCSTSRVSLVLRFQGRVASRCYPAGRASYVRFSRSGIVSVVNGVT